MGTDISRTSVNHTNNALSRSSWADISLRFAAGVIVISIPEELLFLMFDIDDWEI